MSGSPSDKALVNSTIIPTWLFPELETLVNDMPVPAILELAHTDASLAQGFRITGANVPKLKKKLINRCRNEELDQSTARWLSENSPAGELLASLSTKTITELKNELMVCLGVEKIALAFLLEPRPRVSKLAAQWSTSPPLPAISADAASEKLLAAAELLLKVRTPPALPVTTAASGRSKVTGNTQAAHTKPKPKDNSAELLKQANIRQRKLQREIEKNKQDLSSVSKQLDKEKETISTLRQQLKTEKTALTKAQSDYATLRREMSTRVHARVKKTNSRIARYWLHSPTETSHALSASAISDNAARSQKKDTLEQRVDKALAEQAATDRHYGNRSTLRRQLDSLEQKIAQLDDAMLNALRPNETLEPLRTEALQQASKIRKTLDGKSGARSGYSNKQLMSQLLSSVVASDDRQDTLRLLDTAAYLATLGVLAGSDVQDLKNARIRRNDIMYEAILPENKDTLSPSKKAEQAILNAEQALVIIDAHNCLLSVPDIKNRFSSSRDAAGRAGKQWLVEAATEVFSTELQTDVLIVFDGDNYHQESAGTRVKVMYSGGNGDQRADNAIIEHLEWIKSSARESSTFVVTNDHDLQQRALELNATIIEASMFSDWYRLIAS